MSKKKKTTKRTSRKKRSISKKKSSKRTVRLPDITDTPLIFGKSCFKKKMADPRGFQAADLKSKYFDIFIKLLAKHGQKLIVKPTGNPGISLSITS